MVAELGDDATACIEAAILHHEHRLRPVPTERAQRAEWEKAIDERIRRLAVKVAPTASAAQTSEWRSALIEALSDLPAMISLTAAKRAIHRPFRFIGDIEHGIREIAGELLDNREKRLAELRWHKAAIERAMNQRALPEPDPAPEITGAAIVAMSDELRALGLARGFLSQEQVDAAMAVADAPA